MKNHIYIIISLLVFLNLPFNANAKNTLQDTFYRNKTNVNKTEKISEIKIKEPILVKNVSEEKKEFWFYFSKIGIVIGFIGGLLGLIVTGYVINDRWFKNAKIYSKIIGFSSSDGTFEIMKIGKQTNSDEMKYGLRIFLKLSINVINKDINYSDVTVFVKFKEFEPVFTGEIYSPRNYSSWTINNINYKLDLPQEKLLYYKSVLKQNTTHLEYINFIVFDKDQMLENHLKNNELIPEYIQLAFKNSEIAKLSNNTNTILTNKMTFNVGAEKFLWEDEIWKKS